MADSILFKRTTVNFVRQSLFTSGFQIKCFRQVKVYLNACFNQLGGLFFKLQIDLRRLDHSEVKGGGRNVKFHYYDWRFFSERQKQQQKQTFDVVIFFNAIGKFRTSKCFLQLPMAYYLWLPRPVGPWGLGQGQLGQFRLGQARLGSITLRQVRLGQVKSGQKVFVNAKMPQVLTPQVVKM